MKTSQSAGLTPPILSQREVEKELDFLVEQVPEGSSVSIHWLCGLGLAS